MSHEFPKNIIEEKQNLEELEVELSKKRELFHQAKGNNDMPSQVRLLEEIAVLKKEISELTDGIESTQE